MMMVHKLIDALARRDPRMYIPVPETNLLATIDAIKAAEKFDFGRLHLERFSDSENGAPAFVVPVLTQAELEFIEEGLVPLPAPVCWYEFSVAPQMTSGLLVRQFPLGWNVLRIDYNRHTGGGTYLGVITRPNREGVMETVAPPEVRELLEHTPSLKEYALSGGELSTARYLTLMLNSKTTTSVYVDCTVAHAARSLRQGTPPPSHTVVTIVSKEYLRAARREGERTHRSPCMHWRRSHRRRVPHETPKAIQSKLDGQWYVIIARILVMKAEPGDHTHEYRVRT